jgi:sulfide:quinone oxidoreductase
MLVEESLRVRGVRDRSEIVVATVQPMLMPNAGEAGSAWLAEQLDVRGISHEVGRTITSIGPGVVELEKSELPFDLLLAVPPHRAPRVVRQSGLTGPSGWIEVEPTSLRTSHEQVFAIGDVTSIPLANGLPLPKAGVIAELEGLRVADAITAAVAGREAESTFDGVASCFVELGTDVAGRVDGEFFAEPAPRLTFAEPSSENAAAKRAFERERLARWFGG